MADMGFLPEVTAILDQMPAGGQRMLFSATLDKGVDKLVERYLTDPVTHSTDDAKASVTTMEHHVLLIDPKHKKTITAEVANRAGRTMVFVRTKLGADRVAHQLREQGVFAAALHGGLNQGARNRVLGAFRDGSLPVLVATDVAARGIHVDDVSVVLQVDPPADHKDYLHRSGRTARAGDKGTVVTLALPHQRRTMERHGPRGRHRRDADQGRPRRRPPRGDRCRHPQRRPGRPRTRSVGSSRARSAAAVARPAVPVAVAPVARARVATAPTVTTAPAARAASAAATRAPLAAERSPEPQPEPPRGRPGCAGAHQLNGQSPGPRDRGSGVGRQNGRVEITDLSGSLLVATPQIEEGVFRRSVVLVLHHDEEGAQGVVLNRPMDARRRRGAARLAGARHRARRCSSRVARSGSTARSAS